MLQQAAQQIKFPAGEGHILPVHRHLMALHIHDQGAGAQAAVRPGPAGALAQGGPDAGQQFLSGKGLGYIVVRPHVQAGHLVHHRIPGGEHNDGHLALPPQAAEHLHAREGG